MLVTDEFRSFVTDAIQRRVLDGVVVDEAHHIVASTQTHWRPAFLEALQLFRTVPSILFLTATLQRSGAVPEHRPTAKRSHVRYSVVPTHQCDSTVEGTTDAVRAQLRRLAEKRGPGEVGPRGVVVFSGGETQWTRAVAAQLDVPIYISPHNK